MHWKDCWLGLLLTALIFGTVGSIPTTLHRRGERVPDDATDWKKVYLWMKDTVEDENYVFYSGGRIGDAKAFTKANPDYLYFDDIFDADFQKDFGGANLGNEDVANACSKAMGLYAKGETRVFGDKDASDDSTWIQTEKPALMKNKKVTKVWSMKNGATKPDDHPDGDLKAESAQLPIKTLQIFWSEIKDEISGTGYYWSFYVGKVDEGVNPCKSKAINNPYNYESESDEAPASVSGSWDIKVDGHKCTFNADTLFCDGVEDMLDIPCFADDRPADTCGLGSSGTVSKAVTHCDW